MIMRRREFIAALGGMAVAWPLAARAQQPAKVPRIGYLAVVRLELPEVQATLDAFRQSLRELGYVEAQSIIIEYRTAEGRVERLPDLAADLVRLKVDLIVTVSQSACRAAQAATATIPIVGVSLSDPVGDHTVASLARPGGNVTGLSYLGVELGPKNLSLLKAPFCGGNSLLGPPPSQRHGSSSGGRGQLVFQLVAVEGESSSLFCSVPIGKRRALDLEDEVLVDDRERAEMGEGSAHDRIGFLGGSRGAIARGNLGKVGGDGDQRITTVGIQGQDALSSYFALDPVFLSGF